MPKENEEPKDLDKRGKKKDKTKEEKEKGKNEEEVKPKQDSKNSPKKEKTYGETSVKKTTGWEDDEDLGYGAQMVEDTGSQRQSGSSISPFTKLAKGLNFKINIRPWKSRGRAQGNWDPKSASYSDIGYHPQLRRRHPISKSTASTSSDYGSIDEPLEARVENSDGNDLDAGPGQVDLELMFQKLKLHNENIAGQRDRSSLKDITFNQLKRQCFTPDNLSSPLINVDEILARANSSTLALAGLAKLRLQTFEAQQRLQRGKINIRSHPGEYAYYYCKTFALPITQGRRGAVFSCFGSFEIPYHEILTPDVLFSNETAEGHPSPREVSEMDAGFELAMQMFQSRAGIYRNGWLVDDATIGDPHRILFLKNPINIRIMKSEFLKLYNDPELGIVFTGFGGDPPENKRRKLSPTSRQGGRDEPTDNDQRRGPNAGNRGRGNGPGRVRGRGTGPGRGRDNQRGGGVTDQYPQLPEGHFMLSIADPLQSNPRHRSNHGLSDEHIRLIIDPNSHYGAPFMDIPLPRDTRQSPIEWPYATFHTDLTITGSTKPGDIELMKENYRRRSIQLRTIVHRAQVHEDETHLEAIYNALLVERMRMAEERVLIRRDYPHLFYFRPPLGQLHTRRSLLPPLPHYEGVYGESIVDLYYFCYGEWLDFLDYLIGRLSITKQNMSRDGYLYKRTDRESVRADTYVTLEGETIAFDPSTYSPPRGPFTVAQVEEMRRDWDRALAEHLNAEEQNSRRWDDYFVNSELYENWRSHDRGTMNAYGPKAPPKPKLEPVVDILYVNGLQMRFEQALAQCQCSAEKRQQITGSAGTSAGPSRDQALTNLIVPADHLDLLLHQVDILRDQRRQVNQERYEPPVLSQTDVPFIGHHTPPAEGDWIPTNLEDFFRWLSINSELEIPTTDSADQVFQRFLNRSSLIRRIVTSYNDRDVNDTRNGIIRNPFTGPRGMSDADIERHINRPIPGQADLSNHRLRELLRFERSAIQLTVSIMRDRFFSIMFGRGPWVDDYILPVDPQQIVILFFKLLKEYIEFLDHMIADLSVNCALVDKEQLRERESMEESEFNIYPNERYDRLQQRQRWLAKKDERRALRKKVALRRKANAKMYDPNYDSDTYFDPDDVDSD